MTPMMKVPTSQRFQPNQFRSFGESEDNGQDDSDDVIASDYTMKRYKSLRDQNNAARLWPRQNNASITGDGGDDALHHRKTRSGDAESSDDDDIKISFKTE